MISDPWFQIFVYDIEQYVYRFSFDVKRFNILPFLSSTETQHYKDEELDSQEDDFLSLAFRDARRAAESIMVGQKIKVEKPQKKASGNKVQKSMKCDKDGPWFSCFGTTCPLASFWKEDLKAGKTMSSKNFASRVYHRADKQISRDAARKAHKDALVFAKSKNGWTLGFWFSILVIKAVVCNIF